MLKKLIGLIPSEYLTIIIIVYVVMAILCWFFGQEDLFESDAAYAISFILSRILMWTILPLLMLGFIDIVIEFFKAVFSA